MGSTKLRSLIKALTWETFGIITLYLMTGNLKLSLGYISIRTIMYFGHERIWKFISWGKTTNGKKI